MSLTINIYEKLSFHPCGNFRENYAQELTIFDTWFGRVSLIVFLILLFGVAPFFLSAYLLYILNTIGILAIAAIGLNILVGYTGQISLGHGAFFGVGAYARRSWRHVWVCRSIFPFPPPALSPP